MLLNLLLGLASMVGCLLLQTVLVLVALRAFLRRVAGMPATALWPMMQALTLVMLLLVAGNIAQVSLWAALFRLLGEFTSFDDAFYHSAVNFTTLGYGDVVMSEGHRLLGPLEGINGVLMIGVSTAALIATLQYVLRRSLPQDAPP